jgi:hypothetical protein
MSINPSTLSPLPKSRTLESCKPVRLNYNLIAIHECTLLFKVAFLKVMISRNAKAVSGQSKCDLDDSRNRVQGDDGCIGCWQFVASKFLEIEKGSNQMAELATVCSKKVRGTFDESRVTKPSA